jgi:4-hydroxybenzoate polyprenyltransferase
VGAQQVGFRRCEAAFRTNQNSRWSGPARAQCLKYRRAAGFIAKKEHALRWPVGKHSVEPDQRRKLRHMGATALFGRLNHVRAQTLLFQPFAQATGGLHRHEAASPQLAGLFSGPVEPVFLERRAQQPQIGRGFLRLGLGLGPHDALFAMRLDNLRPPGTVAAIEQFNHIPRRMAHHGDQIMRGGLIQRHRTACGQRRINKQANGWARHSFCLACARFFIKVLPMTPDAAPQSWITRAPKGLQPYFRLARFDRPIGAWLLFWPCVWGVLLAPIPLGRAQALLSLLFGFGSIAMRSAGCVWNDILDRDLDAQVERTRARPLPAGEVTVTRALVFMVLLCLIGLAVLLLLPPAAQVTALVALPLVAVYPLMKRITWWPQAWLGLTFNWGALVGYAAVAAGIDTHALLLYAGGIFWTLGYDTIYAVQDIEDDALAGVKSTARRLGASLTRAIASFYSASVLAMALAMPAMALACLAFALHLAWQGLRLRQSRGAVSAALALQLFRSNAVAGAALAAGMALFRVSFG